MDKEQNLIFDMAVEHESRIRMLEADYKSINRKLDTEDF